MAQAESTRQRQSRLSQGQEAITESAKRQVGTVTTVAQEAVTSGAWAYPLLVRRISHHHDSPDSLLTPGCLLPHIPCARLTGGLTVLTPDPSLIKPILPGLFRGALVSLAIIAALFFFTYLPQVAVLAFVSGPLGTLYSSVYNFLPLLLSANLPSPHPLEEPTLFYRILPLPHYFFSPLSSSYPGWLGTCGTERHRAPFPLPWFGRSWLYGRLEVGATKLVTPGAIVLVKLCTRYTQRHRPEALS
jgi:hypothetical protein